MKEIILALRAEGKSYRQIVKEVGCSIATVSFHCGLGQKEKSNLRNKNWKEKNHDRNGILNRITKFKSKIRTFTNQLNSVSIDDVLDILKKQNNKCYLSGDDLNLSGGDNYHFDHIIPRSKGGLSVKENLGLATKQANLSKSDMTVEEYLEFCKKVLEHNGYTVIKN